jgi:uncharacterized oxidoreductase
MKLTGNTILITGGGSGIGRGLAEELLKLGNQVIIAGRRRHALDETIAANPGMKAIELDIESPAAIKRFAAQIIAEFPTLDMLINNAGIMRAENLTAQQADLQDAEAIVTTNLLGPIRLTAALLPHLQARPSAVIVNVSSGLAFVPLAFTPTYCATKAGIHSYTQSLRYQLKDSAIEVFELIPPYVQTHLMDGADDPRAMPLGRFIAEVMDIWKSDPAPAEICVQNVNGLRLAAEQGRYDGTFQGLNDAMAARF